MIRLNAFAAAYHLYELFVKHTHNKCKIYICIFIYTYTLYICYIFFFLIHQSWDLKIQSSLSSLFFPSFASLIHRAEQHLPSFTILQVKKYIRYSFKHVTFINIEKRQEEWRKTSVKFVLRHNFAMHDSSRETMWVNRGRENNCRPRKGLLINYYNNKFYHIDLPSFNLRTKWLISAFISLVVWVLNFIHNYRHTYTFHITGNKYLRKKGATRHNRMFRFL